MASDQATTSTAAPPVDTNSVGHTLKIALLLCLVCSILVSVFAVMLKPMQEENRRAFREKSILLAAGLYEPGAKVSELFEETVEPLVLNLETGEIDTSADPDDIDVQKMVNRADESDVIESDIANIKRREKRTVIYRIKDKQRAGGELIVFPIRGYGLWSILKGYIALDVTDISRGPENVMIRGLTFYEHGETPGLGGEVDNPLWKAKWAGKKVFDENWNVKIKVSKGAEGIYEVDALSGASITSRGVSNMLAYWLGKSGFMPYLKRLAGVDSAAAPGGGEDSHADDGAAENHSEAKEDHHG